MKIDLDAKLRVLGASSTECMEYIISVDMEWGGAMEANGFTRRRFDGHGALRGEGQSHTWPVLLYPPSPFIIELR